MLMLEKLKRRLNSKKKSVDIAKLNDYDRRDRDKDQSWWHHPIGNHYAGLFSMALVHSNIPSEDRCHIEIGQHMTFAGVYDGHGGLNISEFLSRTMLYNILESAAKTSDSSLTPEVFLDCFATTDKDAMIYIHRNIEKDPRMLVAGSCCLVGIIFRKTLYIANLGDSRAVLGYVNELNDVVAEQLTRDHNTCRLEVRQDLRSKFPDDDTIVTFERQSYRLKGMVQVSRAFGNKRLKPVESEDPCYISTEPSVIIRKIKYRDRFIILASDGLWDKISVQDAVAIVNKYPKEGIARRLISEALNLAFYDPSFQKYVTCCKWIRSQMRRTLHDDITVIVIFLDIDKIFSDASSSSVVEDITLEGLCKPRPSMRLRGIK